MTKHAMIINLNQINQILFIRRINNLTCLSLKDNTQVFTEFPLSLFDEVLPQEKFFRAHKGYIINLDETSEIVQKGNAHFALLTCGNRIPIAKRRKKILFERLLVKFS